MDIRTLDEKELISEIDKGNYPNLDLMNEMYRRFLYQKDRVKQIKKMYEDKDGRTT